MSHSARRRLRPRFARIAEALEPRLFLSAYTVTSLADSGPGSLRDAVAQANANPGADTISFAVTGEIDLTSGQLELSDAVTINGPGADRLTISGSYRSRILQVDHVDAAISGLTFTKGQAPPGGDGGAVWNGGNLTLTHATFSYNYAGGGFGSQSGAGGRGGALFNHQTVRASFAVFMNNTAGDGTFAAPSPGGAGGAIYSDDTSQLFLDSSTLMNNHAGSGGVFGSGGGGSGGAVADFGQAVITNDTIAYNSAGAGGFAGGVGAQGGVGGYGGGMVLSGSCSVTNCTIYGNNAGNGGRGSDSGLPGHFYGGPGGLGGSGGGIDLGSLNCSIESCTITQNRAGAGGLGGMGATQAPPGAPGIASGLWDPDQSGHLLLVNTIIAGNANAGAFDDAEMVISNLDPASDFNLLGNASAVTYSAPGGGAHNRTGTTSQPLDPKLAPLANYGGPTQTVALLPGSPALDAGDNSLADGTDQRGFPRKFGAAVDIGAYEAQPPAVPGDVNHDGATNFADLLLLAQNFGKSTPLYELGDLDGNGTADFSDLLFLAQNYGSSSNTMSADLLAQTQSTRKLRSSIPSFVARDRHPT